MVPMTKPRMASNSVYQVSESSSPLAIILNASVKMPTGEPTRKAEIHPTRTPISHSAKKAITAAACSIARPSGVSKLGAAACARALSAFAEGLSRASSGSRGFLGLDVKLGAERVKIAGEPAVAAGRDRRVPRRYRCRARS